MLHAEDYLMSVRRVSKAQLVRARKVKRTDASLTCQASKGHIFPEVLPEKL